MKNALIIFALLFTSSTPLFAGSSFPSDSVDVQFNLKRDSMVDLTYRLIDRSVYFKLKMLNESQNGFYSMVREFNDGSFESVDIRQMVANEINQPIMYCFVDKAIPVVNFTYVLMRISNETEEVSRWSYCAETGQICEEFMKQSFAIQD
jgi:hypothetical protein